MDAALHELRLQAESDLLGTLLLFGTSDDFTDAIKDVKSKVSVSDIFDAAYFPGQNARIYAAICACDHPHEINVAQEMADTGTLKPGDCAYLAHLIAVCPSVCISAYQDYVDTILRCSGKQVARPKFTDGLR